jgi:hypothetical protein
MELAPCPELPCGKEYAMQHPFDELTKALAHEMPRRQALRRLGGGLATALLASLGLGEAWGQSRGCYSYCRARVSPRLPTALANCVAGCLDCLEGKGELCGVSREGVVTCCPAFTYCKDGECRALELPPGLLFCGQKVCGAGEKCCADVTCIAIEKVCCPSPTGSGVLICLPGRTCCASYSPTLPSAMTCCEPGDFCCSGAHDVNCCPPDDECDPVTGKCRVPL